MSPTTKPPALLVFAGLDPSGGAGLVADIQTATALGVHVLAVATTLTSQSLTEFDSFSAIDAATVDSQVAAAVRDFDVVAVKIGAVSTSPVLNSIAAWVRRLAPQHVIVDPVRVSSSGGSLFHDIPGRDYRERVLSMNPILTPNHAELIELCENDDPNETDIGKLLAEGARAVLVTDGDGDGDVCTHRLTGPDNLEKTFTHARLRGSFRGSGCTLSTALAARLLQGDRLERAVQTALGFTFAAIGAASVRVADGRIGVPDRRVHS